MPKSDLTWYKTIANELMRAMKTVPQRKIASEIGESQQTVCYRIANVYPKQLSQMIRILDLAGYEIVRKGAKKG